MQSFYAMMVDLSSKNCLVVGGGAVAERKADSLINSSAKVAVISPTVTPVLKKWAERGLLDLKQRSYQQADGKDVFLVIAATDQQQINEQVYQDAQKRKQWINVVDQPKLCNFTVPSMIHRGKLHIAISTSGASPTLAKQIRQDLEEVYGVEYELYLDLLHQARVYIRKHVPNKQERTRLVKELVEKDWLTLCQQLHPDQAESRMMNWVEEQTEKGQIGGTVDA